MKQSLKTNLFGFWPTSGLMLLPVLGCLYSSSTLSDPATITDVNQSNPQKNRFDHAAQNNKNSLLSTLTTDAIKVSAHISIFTAELIATDAAERELNQFRTGHHDGIPSVYSFDSTGSKELFKGKYYQQLTAHLVEELAKWYKGKIPTSNGIFNQANSFRVFSPNDALWEMTDGIDMADIVGTFTYYVRATTKDDIIYFQGVNKISLESYSGENYLGHGLVNNPKLGPLSSTAQVFKWQVAIPEKYRK